MIENPFASPRIVDPAVDVDSLPLMVRRPWAMLLAGMFLGGVIGATAGGVTSGTIGFVAVVSGSDIRDPDPDIKSAAKPPAIAVVVIGAFLGAFQGGWMGVVVGGVAGLISGIATPLRIAVPMWTAAVLAAIGGGSLEAWPPLWSLETPRQSSRERFSRAAPGFLREHFWGARLPRSRCGGGVRRANCGFEPGRGRVAGIQ